MKLVFIGIQGSGKGTQARILEEKFGFKLFETGGVLRAMSKEDSDLGRLVKETIDAGKHVSPEIVEDILKDILVKNEGGNLIFDGFVRNEGNKQSFDKIVGDYRVVFFDLPEEKAKERLLGRMYDKETQETFVAGTLVNPKNGNTLVKRADDEESAIMQRIRLFYDVTMPIVEEYRTRGILVDVNANQSIDDVAKELALKLGL